MDDRHELADQIRALQAKQMEIGAKKTELQDVINAKVLDIIRSELAVYDCYVLDEYDRLSGGTLSMSDVRALSDKIGEPLDINACTVNIPYTDSIVHRGQAFVTMRGERRMCSRLSIDDLMFGVSDEELLSEPHDEGHIRFTRMIMCKRTMVTD